MSRFIITGPDILTNDKNRPFIESGSILIDDGLIVEIGSAEKIKNKYPGVDVENPGRGIITPGLVNLHHHLYSSLARGWNPERPAPENFPQVLKDIWWKLDKGLELDDIYYSAMIGLCESVRMGVTSVIDHHASQKTVIGSLDQIIRAFGEVGVNGSTCFELTDRGGKEIFEAGLRETVSALSKRPLFAKGGRYAPMVGLHASMTLSDESLKEIAETTKAYDAGYHFHLAEDKSDQDDSQDRYGIRATERFAKFGMLGEKSLAIHGVHLDDREIKLLSETGTNLVLCPRSNQNNAVGIPKWWQYDGVSIGLGTDGIGSDMIGEAKSALYISHHENENPSFGFAEIVNMLLNNNPLIFEKVTGRKCGGISPGYPADLVFWSYDSPTPVNENNIGGHYLYGLYNHQADSVWVNGEKILAQGEFLRFDYGKLALRAREAAKKLWERI